MRKRLLIISQTAPFPVYANGASLRIFHLIRGFSKHYDCEVIMLEKMVCSESERTSLGRNVSITALPPKCRGRVIATFLKVCSPKRLYEKAVLSKIEGRIKAYKPDYVFVEQGLMAQYSDAHKGIPSVLSVVDSISLAAKNEYNLTSTIWKKIMWSYIYIQRRWLEWYYYSRFSSVTAVAEADAHYLAGFVGRPVCFIPNGVDLDYFTPDYVRGGRDAIVFTGTLSASMNNETCVFLLRHVFPKIHQLYPSIKFIIGGRRPTVTVRRLLPKYVELVEDPEDIRVCLDRCLLFVAPIAYGPGIKNSVLQAMAMGCAVCVTPIVAEPLGILSKDNNAAVGFVAERSLFCDTVAELLNDTERLIAVGKCARGYVANRFSWSSVVGKYVTQIEDSLPCGQRR
jgi:glycosyltransferase involved in cell wall biosynthesis